MTSSRLEHNSPASVQSPGEASKEKVFSMLQFLSSSLAILGMGGLGLLFTFMGLSEGLPTGLASLTIAGAAFWLGALLLPSAIFSLLRLIGAPVRSDFLSQRGLRLVGLAIFLFPLILYLGNWAAQQDGLASLTFPIFHIFATTLPVGWVIYLAVRNLGVGSPQRAWSVFGTGLVLGPAIILALETIVMIAGLIVIGIVILSQPELADQLTNLTNLFSNNPNNLPDPDAILAILGPYLTQPFTILGTLAFTSVLVPLIEEAFKPIGVWFLLGRGITPAAGFAAGALSGAGFALFENLLLSANIEGWGTLQIARLGTAIVHILATGLMGYALAWTWQNRKAGRLIVIYLGVVLLHGAWNALSMLMTFGEIQRSLGTSAETSWLIRLGELAPYGMIAMALGSLMVLIGLNARLRPDQTASSTTLMSQ